MGGFYFWCYLGGLFRGGVLDVIWSFGGKPSVLLRGELDRLVCGGSCVFSLRPGGIGWLVACVIGGAWGW